jgi:pimeloyl-ACP methyl ester carboxylesterase
MPSVHLQHRDSGRGTPIVLLHAFPLSGAMWLAQREALSASHRVITPDLRGFGGTPIGHDEPSLDHSADDVAAMLDDLGLDRVVLGGLSMGGYVAMAFLRRHPDRVSALVLADTKATADPTAVRDNRERIALEVTGAAGTQILADEVLPSLIGPTTVEERPLVLGRVRGLVQAAPTTAVAWAERAMAARPDSLDVLAATNVPALVIVGEEDKLSTVDDAEAMVEALADARLVVIPRAGHLTAVEEPDAFTAAVETFVAAVPRRADVSEPH